MQVPQNRTSGSSVHSLERAFELLELLSDSGGSQGLSQLSSSSGLPLATIHRLMGTLVRTGYVRRGGSRQYVLGPRLIRLGEMASQMLGSWAKPHLAELVELTGETANLAVLEGDTVVYLAQVPGRHSMRMFTEPGRRFDPHCTAVGKAMLAQLPEAQVRDILSRTGLTARTANTITDPDLLLAHLGVIKPPGARPRRERAGSRRALRSGGHPRLADHGGDLGVRPAGQDDRGCPEGHCPGPAARGSRAVQGLQRRGERRLAAAPQPAGRATGSSADWRPPVCRTAPLAPCPGPRRLPVLVSHLAKPVPDRSVSDGRARRTRNRGSRADGIAVLTARPDHAKIPLIRSFYPLYGNFA